MSERHVVTEAPAGMYLLQMDLTPTGAYLAFGVPMHLLANHEISLEDVLGVEARLLEEELFEAGEWQARFDLLDAFFLARFNSGSEASPGVFWALQRLRERQGRYPVLRLASELGWSQARLIQGFRREVGVTPKAMASILRFHRATALIDAGSERSLASIAAACGYHDQAHFTHQFRRHAGITPSQYRDDLVAERQLRFVTG